jgi:cyanophycinase
MTAELGKRDCLQMLLSGTAAGVIGAGFAARQAGLSQVMSLDIGGTSAGASVMSNAMLTGRGRRLKGPEAAELRKIARGMADVALGFGFFPGAIVDQHFMQRARYNRLLSAVLDHPQLLGVGIDEETALLVRPDGIWEVLGSHYVKIFDARRARILEDDDMLAGATDIRMHILPAGSLYSPKRRHALLPGG